MGYRGMYSSIKVNHMITEVLTTNRTGLTASEILRKIRTLHHIPYGDITRKDINSVLYANCEDDNSKFKRVEANKPLWYLRFPPKCEPDAPNSLQLLVRDMIERTLNTCIKKNYIRPEYSSSQVWIDKMFQELVDKNEDAFMAKIGNYFEDKENDSCEPPAKPLNKTSKGFNFINLRSLVDENEH